MSLQVAYTISAIICIEIKTITNIFKEPLTFLCISPTLTPTILLNDEGTMGGGGEDIISFTPKEGLTAA